MIEYIEREMAIEAIDESLKRVFVVPVGKSIMDKVLTADVMPVVHGRWREIEHGETGHLCECSACKEWMLFYYGFVANYCPNCGARMDLEDKE